MTGKKGKLIPFPEKVLTEIEEMSKETGISANQLIIMASHSLVANYREKGSFIFVDLLNPEFRQSSNRNK